MSNMLKFGVPKGSLENATIELFKKAGWTIIPSSRNYFPSIDDEEIKCNLIRSQEMGMYVERGTIDAGIAGKDWVLENDSDVEFICDLVYSKVSKRPTKWVLVVTENSPIKKIEDLKNKTISTELVKFTKKYFAERNIPVKVEFSWGATEVKVPTLADAIVEITETGSSLAANNLVIIDEVMESVTQFIANKESVKDNWKKDKLEKINMLLQGVLEADNKVGLMMNVEKKNLDRILKILPAIQKPTVSSLSDADWCALNTIIEEHTARDLIPLLKKNGANGIVEYPLNKIIN